MTAVKRAASFTMGRHAMDPTVRRDYGARAMADALSGFDLANDR